MWYFAWVLGVSAAVMLGVLNAMWFEAQESAEKPFRAEKDNPS